eukprot:3105078-Amphidinium_carterae.1
MHVLIHYCCGRPSAIGPSNDQVAYHATGILCRTTIMTPMANTIVPPTLYSKAFRLSFEPPLRHIPCYMQLHMLASAATRSPI